MMRFARAREIGLGVLLFGVPGLVRAAPAGVASALPSAETSGPEAASAEPEPGAAASAPPPARERPRTWQIYQRPLPGAEQSWGPPNGQMPAVAEFAEAPPDPSRVPPTGTARIAVGAVVGTLGLGVLGLGIAAQTTDVLGADHRAGVPLIGAGLVTAAIGWGLFTHGILRRGAYLRWKGAQATVAPALGGATLVLRF